MGPRADAVLFDLDGTLLDTLEDLATAMNDALAGRGLPVHPVDRYRVFVGEGVAELVRRAAPAGSDEPLLRALLEEMRSGYEKGWARCTRPYPGIEELLDELAGRGLKLAVLSNKLEEFTRAMVAHFLGRWRFGAVFGASERFPRKPDPASALAIAVELDVAPQDFLYLGDTAIDMRTAVGAGMFPVGALWGFRDADELRLSGAKALLREPLELLPLVDGGASTWPLADRSR
jgi:phosphoglycolate phosphatase